MAITGEAPKQPIFDSHLHIIDPQHPLVPNRGFTPDPFPVKTYQESVSTLGVCAGAVVSGSFQAFDQSYLVEALERLGPAYVGVTQLPSTVTDSELRSLREKGVRAIRFNLFRGGSAKLEELEELARRTYDVAGWHAELYVHSRDLPDLEDRLAALPKFSIDHLGMADDGFDTLIRLVERGAKVKATGFGRISHDPAEAMRRINKANPEALMFGTDLPSTRADRPFRPTDIDLVAETLGDTDAARALWTNALEFYGVEPPQ
ncbi:amidohydrolase family protein [Rhodococcoides yunnanense]|uniref:Amidohydrolase family protein n=1 Tax=Rhodococcoides yunnanense TaxID=278209 RepID=A0ABU4BIU5_9NOCA|nr:amidohydrolase family protein [Rhodococcus yunnanensis]MDV6263994.1 amidohydrolase family protein [Rhodococcus yunnanensis]